MNSALIPGSETTQSMNNSLNKKWISYIKQWKKRNSKHLSRFLKNPASNPQLYQSDKIRCQLSNPMWYLRSVRLGLVVAAIGTIHFLPTLTSEKTQNLYYKSWNNTPSKATWAVNSRKIRIRLNFCSRWPTDRLWFNSKFLLKRAGRRKIRDSTRCASGSPKRTYLNFKKTTSNF